LPRKYGVRGLPREYGEWRVVRLRSVGLGFREMMPWVGDATATSRLRSSPEKNAVVNPVFLAATQDDGWERPNYLDFPAMLCSTAVVGFTKGYHYDQQMGESKPLG
jgi:hypothetical protein